MSITERDKENILDFVNLIKKRYHAYYSSGESKRHIQLIEAEKELMKLLDSLIIREND
jgi:hypothetical protein